MLRAYVRKTDHSLLINLSAQQLGIAGETRSNEDPPESLKISVPVARFGANFWRLGGGDAILDFLMETFLVNLRWRG